ncbi:cation diffusion facilitator family transporter [Paenibacillus beijingensis]|uniref:cation diffusion facilitator family transporter n=1 Tax=Paenibacillus beijingensis TaxID=1126833 RepID=UPI0009E54F44|nr:cation diffusion facilitator family transporter [Paenibacillus beijingensis]
MGFGHHHGPDGHSHTHGGVDSNIIQSKEATKVLLISLVGLLITALFQAIIVAISGSVALLADTIHNFGDALTSIPLWIAFVLSRKLPTKRFTYGLNRTEDIAGLIIVLVIAFSAFVAGYQSVMRMIHGSTFTHLGATSIAAIVGFIGNEIVAIYRIRMGKKMGSAALIADGQHARVDGMTSLAVLVGVLGVWLGFPIVDPLVGLVITIMILFIVKDSAKAVFTRLLDGIEPETIDTITRSASQVEGVQTVNDIKARWFGHEILAEISITTDSNLSVREGHAIAQNVIHRLQHDIEHLGKVQVHVDPVEEQGYSFHEHAHFHAAKHSHKHGHDHHHDPHDHHHKHQHHHDHDLKHDPSHDDHKHRHHSHHSHLQPAAK